MNICFTNYSSTIHFSLQKRACPWLWKPLHSYPDRVLVCRCVVVRDQRVCASTRQMLIRRSGRFSTLCRSSAAGCRRWSKRGVTVEQRLLEAMSGGRPACWPALPRPHNDCKCLQQVRRPAAAIETPRPRSRSVCSSISILGDQWSPHIQMGSPQTHKHFSFVYPIMHHWL